jgi:uroporphyrinogen-III synthase
VEQGENGVGKEHARPGVTHHRSDLITLTGRIAVNRTFAAGRFSLLERATVQPVSCIGKKFAALLARNGPAAVMISTETTDHGSSGPGFTLHAF